MTPDERKALGALMSAASHTAGLIERAHPDTSQRLMTAVRACIDMVASPSVASVASAPRKEAGQEAGEPTGFNASTDATTEVALAERIARQAHAGQKEESTGDDYIHHVERVVALVEGDDAKAVAWLHDVIEDCSIFADDGDGWLRAIGFSERVIAAVLWLTRGSRGAAPTIPYKEYIENIATSGDVLARAVKIADLHDHLRPNCPERLRPRYEQALARLAPSNVGESVIAGGSDGKVSEVRRVEVDRAALPEVRTTMNQPTTSDDCGSRSTDGDVRQATGAGRVLHGSGGTTHTQDVLPAEPCRVRATEAAVQSADRTRREAGKPVDGRPVGFESRPTPNPSPSMAASSPSGSLSITDGVVPSRGASGQSNPAITGASVAALLRRLALQLLGVVPLGDQVDAAMAWCTAQDAEQQRLCALINQNATAAVIRYEELAAYIRAFNCCHEHTPDCWEGDGSCVVCEGHALHARAEAAEAKLAALIAELDKLEGSAAWSPNMARGYVVGMSDVAAVLARYREPTP